MRGMRWAEDFVAQHRLPADYAGIAQPFAGLLAERIERLRVSAGRPILVGVSGAQGSGKTTFARFLAKWLSRRMQLSAVCFSLDDVYLTRAERQALAQSRTSAAGNERRSRYPRCCAGPPDPGCAYASRRSPEGRRAGIRQGHRRPCTRAGLAESGRAGGRRAVRGLVRGRAPAAAGSARRSRKRAGSGGGSRRGLEDRGQRAPAHGLLGIVRAPGPAGHAARSLLRQRLRVARPAGTQAARGSA